jgi:hypothetical protein
MIELATPTIKRKDPLIAAPVIFRSATRLPAARVTKHTNDTPHATHVIQFVVDVRANGDGYVLKCWINGVHVRFRKIFAYHDDDNGTMAK